MDLYYLCYFEVEAQASLPYIQMKDTSTYGLLVQGIYGI